MELLEIGRVVGTHGIKGEIKIKTDLNSVQKKQVFALNSTLIIDKVAYKIKSYRVHKNLDMITFFEFNNINQVLDFVKKKVYKDEDELNLGNDNVLDSELMTYKVLTTEGQQGLIKSIEITGPNYKVLRLEIKGKEVLLPYHKDFIEEIRKEDKTIIVKLL